MPGTFATFERGEGPIVAVALHAGHALRDELAALSVLGDDARLREEDPCTGEWTRCAPTRVVVDRSRFEVDCNRPRERAVYRVPEDAWDLHLWSDALADDIAARSLELYDAFYSEMRALLADIVSEYGYAVVLDLHSYNHRRSGPDGAPAPRDENPDVNLGTGHLDRTRWGAVAEECLGTLREALVDADVRENVKFRGGHLSHWVAKEFGGAVCVLAIEFKKTYMDEWTGVADAAAVARIASALCVLVARLRRSVSLS
ncbi:MAG: N-formylglutamate amidohydrolase [Coriobacteriia bacterium]